ncbi:MAG: glycosyltransferase family 4 protein [Methylocystis sp.]|uniref:glycosyltransferase family 4 protein n=1 Tax=Methylocystis sp. TaxID=1911079 RepID=UPI003DA61290
MTAAGDHTAIAAAAHVPLRILHVMRAPVGGLFRHVADLARAQAQAGHAVGIVADSATGGDDAARVLEPLSQSLALGVTRLPMHRLPHLDDLRMAWRIAALAQGLSPDILHGHGAKGGLYARLPALLPGFPAPPRPLARAYTPHGGSLHFRRRTPLGGAFFAAERLMARVTDFIPFESDYARRRFCEVIGSPPPLARVVHNGLLPEEFATIPPAPDAADFVFIGEMRVAKGVEDLLRAFASLPGALRLSLVGSGSDEAAFRGLSERLGLSNRVQFLPRMPTRAALRRGRILVAPSRAESLPYIVIEAIAARRPVVASSVGGVPEIFGAHAHLLPPPGDPPALAAAMDAALHMAGAEREALTDDLAAHASDRFTIERMNAGILAGYRAALAALG